MKTTLLVLLLSTLLNSFTMAQDGMLDASFGTGGKVWTVFNNNIDIAQSIAIQPDGKIIVAGYASYPITGYRFAIARYNADGSPDNSFGTSGQTTVAFFQAPAFCTSIALQPDGKIVLGGYVQSFSNSSDFAITRLFTDGKLDLAFGNGGMVTLDFSHSDDRISSLVIGPRGRILAAGRSSTNGIVHQFALAQYNEFGQLDFSFGVDGKVRTDFDGGHVAYGTAAMLQPDQKIVVAGYALNTLGKADFAAVRYDSNGVMDAGFGIGGRIISDFGYYDICTSVALQPDGRIVLLGKSFDNSFGAPVYVLVSRYDTSGQADPGFGSNGKMISRLNDANMNAMVLGSDGRMAMAGKIAAPRPESPLDAVVAQYTNNGNVNLSFGNNGSTTTDWANNYDEAYAVAVQPDGKIIIAGGGGQGGTAQIFALSRYTGSFNFRVANWIAAADNNWNNPANWSTGAVPDCYTDVNITSSTLCIVDSHVFCHSLNLSPGANLKVSGKLEVVRKL